MQNIKSKYPAKKSTSCSTLTANYHPNSDTHHEPTDHAPPDALNDPRPHPAENLERHDEQRAKVKRIERRAAAPHTQGTVGGRPLAAERHSDVLRERAFDFPERFAPRCCALLVWRVLRRCRRGNDLAQVGKPHSALNLAPPQEALRCFRPDGREGLGRAEEARAQREGRARAEGGCRGQGRRGDDV